MQLPIAPHLGHVFEFSWVLAGCERFCKSKEQDRITVQQVWDVTWKGWQGSSESGRDGVSGLTERNDNDYAVKRVRNATSTASAS